MSLDHNIKFIKLSNIVFFHAVQAYYIDYVSLFAQGSA